MKLKELLTNTNYECVKIGTSKGQSLLYANVVDFNLIKQKENDIIAKYKKDLEIKQGFLDRLDSNYEATRKNLERYKNKEWVKKEIAYYKISKQKDSAEQIQKIKYRAKNIDELLMHFKEVYEQNKIKLPKRIKYLNNILTRWIPLLDREVVDYYPSISFDEPNTIIVIVKGVENGKYWSVSEGKRDELERYIK